MKITNNFDGRRKKDELDGKPADNSRSISGYFRSNGMSGITVAKINKKSDSDLWNRCAGTADYVISGAFFVLPVLPLPVGAGRKAAGTDYIHGDFYDSWHPADGKSNPQRTCGRTSGT